LRWVLGLVVALAVAPMLGAAVHVGVGSWGGAYDVEGVPERAVGMVLGAKAGPNGPSDFLAARLEVARRLYRQGKISAILVSGDGRERPSSETAAMRDYLVERGIPDEHIVEDPAGFDTYDSCVRAHEVYGVRELILVTQDYHLGRALTICRAAGMDAVGVGDTSMLGRYPLNWIKGWLREWPANVKMEWDLLTARPPQSDPFDGALLEAVGDR
jgi:vancomycin permeability regulator SanA